MDTRELGCKCDECPLNGKAKPVCAKSVPNPRLTIVFESAGTRDEETGELGHGAVGKVIKGQLAKAGCSYDQVFKTAAILCRPKKKLKPQEWKAALNACWPRLERELSTIPNKKGLILGSKALQILTGKAVIKDWQGAPIEGAGWAWIPAEYPGKPSKIPVLRMFVRRALQFADGRLPTWTYPTLHLEPGPEMVAALERILASGDAVGVDIETLGIDPLTNDISCLGLSTLTDVVSAPWDAYHAGKWGDQKRLLDYPDGPRIKELMVALLEGPAVKVMQNGQHDVLGLRQKGIHVQNFSFDTLLAHAIVAPGVPHDLGFIITTEWPAPRHKSEFHVSTDLKGTDVFVKRDPLKLRDYNAKDAYTTRLLKEPLEKRIEQTHNGRYLFDQATKLGKVAMKMRENGCLVDTTKFATHRAGLLKRMEEDRAKFDELTGGKYQLGKAGNHSDLKGLFFDKMRIQPLSYTDDGKPQLNAHMLSHIISLGGPAGEIARYVLDFRQAQKLISTYIDGLTLDKRNYVHPDWKVTAAITGRWSCAGPNMMNVPARHPRKMRDLFIAPPGQWIVGADFSALEARIMAILTGAKRLLEWFNNGDDVHTKNAELVFGRKIEKKSVERELAKTVLYGVGYNFSDDVTQVFTKLKSEFPKITYQMVQAVRRKMIFEVHPEIRDWQVRQKARTEELGYVEEQVSGRREYFHDWKVDVNQALNFPYQALGAELANRAILAVDNALDWRTESIHTFVHDALYLVGPDKDRLAQILKDHMEQTLTLNGHTMKFTVDVGYGQDWLNLVKI